MIYCWEGPRTSHTFDLFWSPGLLELCHWPLVKVRWICNVSLHLSLVFSSPIRRRKRKTKDKERFFHRTIPNHTEDAQSEFDSALETKTNHGRLIVSASREANVGPMPASWTFGCSRITSSESWYCSFQLPTFFHGWSTRFPTFFNVQLWMSHSNSVLLIYSGHTWQ